MRYGTYTSCHRRPNHLETLSAGSGRKARDSGPPRSAPQFAAESLRPRALRGVCARRPARQLRALWPGKGTTRRDLCSRGARGTDPAFARQWPGAPGVAVRGRSAVHAGRQAAAEDDTMSRTTPPQRSFADLEFVRQGIQLEPTLNAIAEFLDTQASLVDRVRRRSDAGPEKARRPGRHGLTPPRCSGH